MRADRSYYGDRLDPSYNRNPATDRQRTALQAVWKQLGNTEPLKLDGITQNEARSLLTRLRNKASVKNPWGYTPPKT